MTYQGVYLTFLGEFIAEIISKKRKIKEKNPKNTKK